MILLLDMTSFSNLYMASIKGNRKTGKFQPTLLLNSSLVCLLCHSPLPTLKILHFSASALTLFLTIILPVASAALPDNIIACWLLALYKMPKTWGLTMHTERHIRPRQIRVQLHPVATVTPSLGTTREEQTSAAATPKEPISAITTLIAHTKIWMRMLRVNYPYVSITNPNKDLVGLAMNARRQIPWKVANLVEPLSIKTLQCANGLCFFLYSIDPGC